VQRYISAQLTLVDILSVMLRDRIRPQILHNKQLWTLPALHYVIVHYRRLLIIC